MNAREGRSLARLDRVAGRFGSEHLHIADAPPVYERFVAKLQTSVERLRELEQKQYSLRPASSSEGRQTTLLRKRLRREYMIPLTRTGKRLFRFASGVERTLKVPHARASHRELVASAEVMLKAVGPHQGLLVSAGFSRGFLAEFRTLTRELRRIATTTSARQAKFARVSRAFREELASANEVLRILDGLVLGRADRDPRLAHSWKDAMRPRKDLGRPRAKKGKRAPNQSPTHNSSEQPSPSTV
jgi:hypothetical protein